MNSKLAGFFSFSFSFFSFVVAKVWHFFLVFFLSNLHFEKKKISKFFCHQVAKIRPKKQYFRVQRGNLGSEWVDLTEKHTKVYT
jgi:hypothetical protein